MAPQPSSKTRGSDSVLYWKPRLPYVALTQSCRLLRTEFRPLYVDALHYSTTLYDLSGLLVLPGLESMEHEVGPILKDLKQWPLPALGIDLLHLISIMRFYEARVRVSRGCSCEYRYELPTRIITWWLLCREDVNSQLRTITDLRLLSKRVTRSTHFNMDYEHVLQITIPSQSSARDQSRAYTFGKWFIRSVSLYGHEVTVRCNCGDSQHTWELSYERNQRRHYSRRKKSYRANMS